jgi:hypothetical protein
MTRSPLLDEVIAAHGGNDRWRTWTQLSLNVGAGGLAVASKFQSSGLRRRHVEVSTDHQKVIFKDYPTRGHRGVFDRGVVRIETDDGRSIQQRVDARGEFGNLRHLLWWDHLDLLYFGASSLWTYLVTPFIFATPGFEVVTLDPWAERNQIWRPLAVTFPADLHTHSRRQIFYFGENALLRRQDYTAEEFGKWAQSAQYCYAYRDFDGLLVPTRRRVHLRRHDNRSRAHPILIWIDIYSVEISTSNG